LPAACLRLSVRRSGPNEVQCMHSEQGRPPQENPSKAPLTWEHPRILPNYNSPANCSKTKLWQETARTKIVNWKPIDLRTPQSNKPAPQNPFRVLTGLVSGASQTSIALDPRSIPVNGPQLVVLIVEIDAAVRSRAVGLSGPASAPAGSAFVSSAAIAVAAVSPASPNWIWRMGWRLT